MSSTTNKAPQGGCSDDITNVSGEQQQASSLQLNNVNNNENNSSNATSNDSSIDNNSSAVDTSIADDNDDETPIANNINDEQQLQLQLANDNGSNDNNNNDNELQLSINNNNDKNKRKWLTTFTQSIVPPVVAAVGTAAGIHHGLITTTEGAFTTTLIGSLTLGTANLVRVYSSSNRAKKRIVSCKTSSTTMVETSSTTILRGELGPPQVVPPPSELLLQQKHLHEIKVKQNMMSITASHAELRRAVSTLESATQRRDEVEHHRDSLLRAIESNTSTVQHVDEEISEVRDEIGTNERDLVDAQEEGRQNELRVEEIDREISTEMARHASAVVVLEREGEEIDIAKVRAAQSIEDKKAMIEKKKAEIRLMIEKSNELNKSEGHEGTDLDVARVQARVNEEESVLHGKRVELESLRQDVSSLDTVITSNTTKASEIRQQAEVLQIEAAKTRAKESLRKADIAKAVEDANNECQEVEKQRKAIKDLTESQEKVASNLKIKLDDNERVVSSKEEEISSTRAELALLEQQIAQYKASTAKTMANLRAEVESASQHCQDIVDNAESELKAARFMHAELTREDGDVMMCQEVGHECRGCLSCSTQSGRVSSSPPAAAAMEEDSNTLKLETILSVKSIETKQFVCDECELTACSQWSGGSFLCLGCSQSHGGIADGLRVMHCKHRELIREKSSSLSDDPADLRMFDTLVPPPALCEHRWCRQIVLRHLMTGSIKDLKYCDCGAVVCDACYDYCQDNDNECIDNAIDESRTNDDDEVDSSDLTYNNLDCRYTSICYKPAKSCYFGQLVKTDTTPHYQTACIYGTGVESATQLAAHYYINRWRLPQKTVETLAHFVPRLFNEIEIVSSTKVTPRNKKELEKLQGRLKRSVSESLYFIASNIRKHIDNNKYSQGNELTRANAVVASLHRIAQLADTSGGITSVEQFDSDAVQDTFGGIDFPWSDFTDGGSRISVSVDVGEPAPIDTTRPDIRRMNEVLRLVFSRKERTSNGTVSYHVEKCFEPITGSSAAMNAEVNHEREINLRVHVCQCLLEVFAKNPVRLRNLLNIEDVANILYVNPDPDDEEEDLDEEEDDVIKLGDMMDTLSHCDLRDQVLLAVKEGRIDRAMSMRIILEYAQLYVLANIDRVPIMCSHDNNKNSSPEAVEENEMKIVSRLNNDDTNTDRILHDIAVVKNEPKYTQQYVSKQNEHLTFILEQTDLIQKIDENMHKCMSNGRWKVNSHKCSYDEFSTILETAIGAAIEAFPDDLSHLKNATLENLCPIYSGEDWGNAEIRGPALKKLARELPMIIANECADERCSRKLLDYDIVERGAVDANHLKQRKGQIPAPADFVTKHGAVKYIEHVIEYEVVANCCYHHPKREHRHQAIIDQKKIRLFKNDASIEDIRRYNPTQLLSMSEDSADTELVRMQDKVTFSFLEFELTGGFSQNGDGCNASDMRCLVYDYFEDLRDHNILFDDLLAASNIEFNNSYGMKYINRRCHDIHGTQVSKSERVAIPFLTGLVKELCGLCDDPSSRPEDMNLTIPSPDEQAGVKADHLGTKKNMIGNTRSLISFMNEVVCCTMVNCFSDRKITYNQDKAKEKGHRGSYAGILSHRNYDTSEHERSIM